MATAATATAPTAATVVLRGTDGVSVRAPRDVVFRYSKFVRGALAGDDADMDVAVEPAAADAADATTATLAFDDEATLTGAVLRVVVDFCVRYAGAPFDPPKAPHDPASDLGSASESAIFDALLAADPRHFLAVLRAADYLDVEPLFAFLKAKTGVLLQTRDVPALHRLFGVETTPKQRADVLLALAKVEVDADGNPVLKKARVADVAADAAVDGV
jgi:hypothetical protein